MTDDAGQTTRQSWNMVKRIISKGLGLGGARIFTVGTGVILSVILGLAVVTATETPVAAQTANKWVFALQQEPDPFGTLTSQGIRVWTTWELDHPERCPVPLHQTLYRRTGKITPDNQNPGDKIWEARSSSPHTPIISQYLKLNTEYQYHLSVLCEPLDQGSIPMVSDQPFGLRILEDDGGPLALHPIFYNGTWVTRQGGEFSGGSTHEARENQASATITYRGFAMAWLTTQDRETSGDYDRARVACDRHLCATMGTSQSTGPTTPRRVMSAGRLSRWSAQSTPDVHRLQVIADDNEGVDVDAFLLVENCYSLFAQCH